METTPEGFHEDWIFECNTTDRDYIENLTSHITGKGCTGLLAASIEVTERLAPYIYEYNKLHDAPLSLTGFSTENRSTVLFKSLGVYKCSPGIIINSEVGTNVATAASGVVTDVAELSETGTTVTVSIGNGYETTTGMIENVNLKKGDKVTTGQLIGTVASPSAYYIEEGPGVYFKLTQYGEPVNPDAYFVE